MPRRLVVSGALALALGVVVPALAQEPAGHQDPFMNPPPKESIYATGAHLEFSWRTTVIGWLGGVPVGRDSEFRSAERDRWWGDPVRVLSPASPAGTASR